MELDEEQLSEIKAALLPFALLGAECSDARTKFKITFNEGADCVTEVTEQDFIRAFHMSARLGENNMPKFIRPEGKSSEEWPLRGADGKPFHERPRPEKYVPPPRHKVTRAFTSTDLFTWAFTLFMIGMVIAAFAFS